MLGEIADTLLYGSFVSLKSSGHVRACCGFLGQSVSLAEAVRPRGSSRRQGRTALPADFGRRTGKPRYGSLAALGGPAGDCPRTGALDAVTVGQHGVQVSQGTLHGLLLPCVAVEHHLDAKGLLQQVCLKAGLPPDAWQQDATTLLTFQACGIHGRVSRCMEAERSPCAEGDRSMFSDRGIWKQRPQAEKWTSPHGAFVGSSGSGRRRLLSRAAESNRPPAG